MKTLIALLAVAACSFAAEAPLSPSGQKPQAALLLLPLQQAPTNSTNGTTTQAPVNDDDKQNLEDETARIMERLRQEQGSERGVYHVYLQDGRLQKVQYTAAPIRPGQQEQQRKATSNNYNQEQQTPEILSPEFAARRGVYFVQVPQERIQALQASRQQASQQQNTEASVSAQYNQEPGNQVNVRYLPLQDSVSGLSSQYRQEQPASEATVRYLPIQLSEDNSQYRQQENEPSSFLASVQYSQVEPIRGPVYSYKPQPLTRILRYAPVF